MNSTSAPDASDLRPFAHRALLNAGFEPDFPGDVLREAENSCDKKLGNERAIRDLRELLWSSIDNDDSRDLDQIEWAEKLPNGDIRLLVGIADVDALVPKNSAVDAHAAVNTTSVYTGVETFPMLPLALSAGATSLLPDMERLAIVTSMRVSTSGNVTREEIFRARVCNRAKLDYEEVGAWLEDRSTLAPALCAQIPGLQQQLEIQSEASQFLRDARTKNGALNFETVEARPVVENGRVTNLTLVAQNRARDLIESFMVAANGAVADFLHSQNSLSIGRVVREPDRWPRIVEIAKNLGDNLPEKPDSLALSSFLERRKKADPAHFADVSLSVVKLLGPGQYEVEKPNDARVGHFGLSVRDYTHSTAPNRRYIDLIIQRLVKACLASSPAPYSEDELKVIAARCMTMENAANKVERLMRKVAAASLLESRIGETFDAIVTGASPKGTFVRLLSLPAEGRVMKGIEGLDVGEKTRVRLTGVNASRGFIDFERV